ncbi:Vitamin K epoxide reductase family protein [Phycisphaerae bacterium RAS1]|nr:Vitamin K epoxide reductase family protein [Phycisphaerae bacterium RAS1]
MDYTPASPTDSVTPAASAPVSRSPIAHAAVGSGYRVVLATAGSLLIAALCICGALVSAVLLRDDLDVFAGGIAQGLFCGGVGLFDCHAVAAHESAWFLGFPLAAWGLFFYIVMTGLSICGLVLRGPDQKAALAIMTILAALAVALDVYLAWVMLARIKVICLNCAATYGVNVALLLLCRLRERAIGGAIRWRHMLPSPRKLLGKDLAEYYGETLKTGVLLLTLAATGFAFYTVTVPVRELAEHGLREVKLLALRLKEGEPDVDMGRFADQPAIGPLEAPIYIAVAGDFQCPYCRSIANLLEELRVAHPTKLRLIFVQSPISKTCNPAIEEDTHPDACWLAALGACAHREGRFWPLHHWLFDELALADVTRESVTRRLAGAGFDAAMIACADSADARAAVAADVALCRELGLTATPSLVINGFVKRGGYFPWMLRQIITKHMIQDGLGCEWKHFVGPPVPAPR